MRSTPRSPRSRPRWRSFRHDADRQKRIAVHRPGTPRAPLRASFPRVSPVASSELQLAPAPTKHSQHHGGQSERFSLSSGGMDGKKRVHGGPGERFSLTLGGMDGGSPRASIGARWGCAVGAFLEFARARGVRKRLGVANFIRGAPRGLRRLIHAITRWSRIAAPRRGAAGEMRPIMSLSGGSGSPHGCRHAKRTATVGRAPTRTSRACRRTWCRACR